MIDTAKPVHFYDDRNKAEYHFTMTQVLYQNDRVCLCLVEGVGEVLFALDGGEVLTSNLMFWYAANS